MKATLRIRLSSHDAHYGGGLVDGARMLGLFGDVATELLVRLDGDEGLFRAYDEVEFLAPVHAGDFIEITGEFTAIGRTSRRMRFEARKVATPRADISDSAAEVLAEPIVVCRASGTCVTPADKQRLPTLPPLVITAAICGAEVFRDATPYIPYTPEELAAEAVRCFDAGARVVHLHMREPDGRPSQRADLFDETSRRIRAERPELILQYSTGGAVGMGVPERADALKLGPDMCSLTMGSVNFGEDVFLNTEPLIRDIAARARAFGVVPELEIFDAGHVDTALRLARRGIINLPAHFDFVLGVPGGMSGSNDRLEFLVGLLPEGSSWSVAGVGRFELPLARLAVGMGGHVRVGLEDNLFVDKGVLAKGSYELVERVVAMATAFGRPIATPAQARQGLRLKP